MFRRTMTTFAIGAVVAGGSIAAVQPASAASYPRGVYAPVDKGDTIEGWANVNTDCEGTFGCYTYVKIEFLPDSTTRLPWLAAGAWSYAAGKWAGPDWNAVSTPYLGCGKYRTIVDSYNDAPGDATLGVELGPVELNLGGGCGAVPQVHVVGGGEHLPLRLIGEARF